MLETDEGSDLSDIAYRSPLALSDFPAGLSPSLNNFLELPPEPERDDADDDDDELPRFSARCMDFLRSAN